MPWCGPLWTCTQTCPAITPRLPKWFIRPCDLKQVQKSIALLVRLGLLAPVKGGKYAVAEKRITTGEQVQSMAVLRFHLETMKLAEQALQEIPKEKRNLSGLTLGISKESYEKIVALIYECQKKIMDVADNDMKADRVYQVDFQVFPVSKI